MDSRSPRRFGRREGRSRDRDSSPGFGRKASADAERSRRAAEAAARQRREEKEQAKIAAQFAELQEKEREEKTAGQRKEERRLRRAKIIAEFEAKKRAKEASSESKPKQAPEPRQAAGLALAATKAKATIETDPAEPAPPPADEFDLFSDSPVPVLPGPNGSGPAAGSAAGVGAGGLRGAVDVDSFTDSEGYYVFRPGEMLNGRFRVIAKQGGGVFSSVLRVTDTQKDDRELVIKVIRANQNMAKAGAQEVTFLQKLAKRDPEGKRHCVRLLYSFDHRKHLCMVFEPMSMNLRELLRKLGQNGLSMEATQAFAKQLFVALKLCRLCSLVHGDIKPDNILVNDKLNHIKLCDFGSAGLRDDCQITPYLCSRFYRAPEVIIGLPYNEQIDVWAVGCVLYELYTGKILFPGGDNNEMLMRHMEISGSFPKKVIRRGTFRDQHYSQNCVFEQKRVDPLSKIVLREPRPDLERPRRDMRRMLQRHSNRVGEKLCAEDKKKLNDLADLLKKMFRMDPVQRITVDGCLAHRFVKSPK